MSHEQHRALIAHAQDVAPEECCGYMSLRDGVVQDVFRAENARHSRYGFDFGFRDLMAANELEDEGLEVGIYHSHPASAPVPSEQDKNVAQYPNWVQLIVSLAGEPEVRAWWIKDGRVEEEPIELA